MINERQVESNPYLRARGETQLRAKHAFERSAGWLYGIVAGVLIVLVTYGWDAVQLLSIHAEFWWVKFALALVTLLPLATLVGGIGGYFNWLFKLFLWGVFGVLCAYLGLHIPIAGVQLALQSIYPILRNAEFVQSTPAATDSFALFAVLCAGLGIVLGLAQSLLVNLAWEHSTEDSKLTMMGALYFLLVLPLAIAFAFLFDTFAHAPLRTPMSLVNSVVDSALNDLPNQDTHGMESQHAVIYQTGQKWRAKFTPDYVVRLAAFDPQGTGDSYVDATFSNGFTLRCGITSYPGFAGTCYDLNTDYSRYVNEFVPGGSFRCDDCQMQVGDAAAQWRTANGRPITASDTVSVQHGAGSGVTVRVTAADGKAFECIVSGANPVTIQICR